VRISDWHERGSCRMAIMRVLPHGDHQVLRQHDYPWGAATSVHDDRNQRRKLLVSLASPREAKDSGTKAAGSVRQAAGKVEDLYGQAKDAAPDATDAAVGYAKQVYGKVAIAQKRLRTSCDPIRLDRY
jgi:hypothetical protein